MAVETEMEGFSRPLKVVDIETVAENLVHEFSKKVKEGGMSAFSIDCVGPQNTNFGGRG